MVRLGKVSIAVKTSGVCDFSRLAVTDWRVRRWRLWFLALMTATRLITREKNGFATAARLGTRNKNFVAATKNFAAATKRFVDRTKHFVVVTKYFCYPYFNK